MKKCVTCRKLKGEKEFINDKGKVVKKCIKCREYMKVYYARNKEYYKEYMKEYSEEHREQIKECKKEYMKEYRERNKVYYKEYNKEYRERNKAWYKEYMKEHNKEYKRRSAKYETYAHKLTVEESPRKGKRGELLVRCTKCGKYFAPTNIDVQNRINALEGRGSGESRLYCSQECKDACEIYGVNYDPYAKHASIERDPAWAKAIKKRASFTCERCGSTSELEAHHEIPVKVDQSLVNDEMNGICLCHECHMKAHSESGCTLADLRKI